jgi:hypothetical protein
MKFSTVRRVFVAGFQAAVLVFVVFHWLLQSATWESIRFTRREGHYSSNGAEMLLLMSIFVLVAVTICELIVSLAYVLATIRARTGYNKGQSAVALALLGLCVYLLVTAPWGQDVRPPR